MKVPTSLQGTDSTKTFIFPLVQLFKKWRMLEKHACIDALKDALVVAHLVDRSLSQPEVRISNPVKVKDTHCQLY